MERRYGAPVAGDEKESVMGYLDHYRSVLLQICEGLSAEDLKRPVVPSGTSLLGMVKHLAYCERGWFQEGVANEPSDLPIDEDDLDADWRIEPHETPEMIFDMYRAACEKSRETLAAVSFDDLRFNEYRGIEYSVRWIALHMLEETARHTGHADILRELIDGKTETGYVWD